MAQISVSHIGLCVSDLDRSMRIYCDGLGFEPAERYDIGDEVADTLEVPHGVELVSQMIARDGFKIELLGWVSPPVEGTPSTQRNQLGITHLSVTVDEIAPVEARLVELGCTVLESTRTVIPFPGGRTELLFLADPDGTRVELMAFVMDPA
ncbi:VOC family protein [Rhabdothermincola salaria]|uniref:VOC family protein n=1 Tax=Rhabdothermincola salaria TaxID=2903142 RepID=UPI001E5517B3|nr:VOC family protein [Rhabdothermincola salaria]MCD9623464.1 VOC family protein [Rhabdothermincola salaria]